jgi:hypothetical protein
LPDKWGWGKSGFFTIAQGFISLQSPQAPIETTTLWKQVWDPLGLPKVNFFCWVLMHRKVLTGENLAKRGIIGPHRCSMCCNALEMTDGSSICGLSICPRSMEDLPSRPQCHSSETDLSG